MGCRFYILLRASCRIQGPNAILCGIVAMDACLGPGWRWMEMLCSLDRG